MAEKSRWEQLGFNPAFFFGFALTLIWPIVAGMLESQEIAGMDWKSRLTLIVFLGLLAGIGYGVIWALLIQKWILHTDYGENTSLPKGWHAALLSLSLTLPVTLSPILYEVITGKNLMASRNLLYGFIAANIGSAIAHIVWYGSEKPNLLALGIDYFPLEQPRIGDDTYRWSFRLPSCILVAPS